MAKNASGPSFGDANLITTQGFGGGPSLLDDRGWELVSPVDKNGGQVDAPETVAAGGVFQAAAQGGDVTFSSAASFGPEAQGAPAGSQYLATRTATGWVNRNLTTPMLSGSYGSGPVGVPYQLFSPDLSRALLSNGHRCRGEAGACPVANPSLPGSGAPAGYENFYLRLADGSFTALIDAADLSHTQIDAAHFDLTLAGASVDLNHVLLSTCAALTADATEVAAADGCDPNAQNLYLWSGGALELVNAIPGAAPAASAGTVSDDGGRVYFTSGGNLYLHAGPVTTQVDADAGGGGAFQAASGDGGVAYFLASGHLWRFLAGSGSASDLTPAGGVSGVLGVSTDGSYLYYQTTSGLFAWHNGSVTEAAAGDDAATPSSYPPATGSARVSANGDALAFVSEAPLTGFDNTDQESGQADSEVYLYEAGADRLRCVSCNPTGARPLGSASIPAPYANGALAGSLRAYKPRALSADGRRVFFDSADALVLGDTNNQPDAYQWEASGSGTCASPEGCLALLSSGRDGSPSSFIDASADGSDVYFRTERSLVPEDPGAFDLYDARVGGGFPPPLVPIPCNGDACQSLPPEPGDRAITSLVAGPGNPPVRYPKRKRRHRQKGGKSKHRRGGHHHRHHHGRAHR